MVQHVGVGHLDVLIAGAGPSGLAMAAEAARFGLRYELIDKALHGALQSQAVFIHARTLEQFERYEIAQRAIECGVQLKRIRIYSDGRRILESSFEDPAGNYPFVLFLPQAQTERLLTEHIEGLGAQIHRGVALESFMDGVDGVECTLLHDDGTRETVQAAYLIGCDGAQSTVRRFLGAARDEGTAQFEVCVGEMRIDGDMPRDELRVYMHAGNIVFIGRIDETHFRVLITPCELPPGRSPQLSDFQNAIDDAAIENMRAGDPRWLGRFSITNRYRPFFSRGRVFLAGDAASIYSPATSEGLNAGIGDAGNLMWKIALVQQKCAGPSLLASYAAERTPHARLHAEESAVAMRAMTASNWFLQRLRDAILIRLASVDAVQERVRDALTELGANYRKSPIVVDAGGSSLLRAGDRAPDCDTVDETQTRFRMFELLKEPIHTALAVVPQSESPLREFAALLAEYRDVMQGSVLIDGDETFRSKYANASGMLYVVRPDGYIGFRSPLGEMAALEDWASEIFT